MQQERLMLGSAFWASLTERALKTVAQALLSVWAVSGGFDLIHADWKSALSIALGAGVLSVLTSFASIPVPTYVPPIDIEAGKHEASGE
jgi:hypothetical protein